jgi:hypothetical protein
MTTIQDDTLGVIARRPGHIPIAERAQDLVTASAYAKAIAGTPFLPESHFRFHHDDHGRLLDGKDGRRYELDLDATVATATIAILAGDELGLAPVSALRSFYIIGNVPALYVKAARGLVQSYGHHIWVPEHSNMRAIVHGQRLGEEHIAPQAATWTIDRAKDANLYPGNQRSVWRRDPESMLVARATGQMCNMIGSDVLLGVAFVEEELDRLAADGEVLALPPGTGTANGTAAAEEETKPKRRRTSRARAPAQPASAPPLPSGPAGPAPDTGTPTEPPPPEPEMITPEQRSRLFPALRKIGVDPDTEDGRANARSLISGWIARRIQSTTELTKDECSTVLGNLDKLGEMAKPLPPENGEEGTRNGNRNRNDEH